MKNNINPNELQESRQPKAGDIWLCNEGTVLVFGVGVYIDYLWQEQESGFEREKALAKNWHKHFKYIENIFDCDEIKDNLPRAYQEIKEQQQYFEKVALQRKIKTCD